MGGRAARSDHSRQGPQRQAGAIPRPDELQTGSVNASCLAVLQHADQFGMRISRRQEAHLTGAPRVPTTIPLSFKGYRR